MSTTEDDSFERIAAEYSRLLNDVADVLGVTRDAAAAILASLARMGWTWERDA
jgi:DNA-binding MarR family transcriptional regulator